MMVVFLGPDGSGKTSVITGVSKCLSTRFSHIQRFHLKFGNPWGKDAAPQNDPHGKQPYSVLFSAFKLAYFWLLYNVGYLRYQREIKSRESLVIFDRYYHDLLIDPARYRYGGPLSWAFYLAQWIPTPHLFVILDAPVEILQDRKTEVTTRECARQRQGYQSFTEKTPQGVLVDASQPLDKVIDTVVDLILNRTGYRQDQELEGVSHGRTILHS